jgi:hypothetical protein
VRELLSQLLHTFAKKQADDSARLGDLAKTVSGHTRKLENHDFLLERQSSQKPTYIELQD